MSAHEETSTKQSVDETNTNDLKESDKKRDKYCWICHTYEETEAIVSCTNCVRVYHRRCLTTPTQAEDTHPDGLQEPREEALNEWTCYECQRLRAEDLAQTTLKQVTEDQFYAMLNSAVKRLKYAASEPFQKEVDTLMFPHYHDFVIHPMDISQMEKKIELRQYVSLEAVAQDTKWIVHNCTIFNGSQNKLTSVAKSLFKMIKHELSEIDVCADCYLSSISKSNEQWFTEPCRTPHPLVFAKIKGFPYWPAKALKSVGTIELDVRFFGAHDRSLVPIDKCYWLSKELPANVRNHTMVNMQPSLQELNTHIKKLELKFGQFRYAPPLMTIDLNEPFVFIDTFKDINCLPTMSENNRVTRKRNHTNNAININNAGSATATPPSNTNDLTSQSSASKATPSIKTRQSLAATAPLAAAESNTRNRRSGRSLIKKETLELTPTTRPANETVDDSIILIEDELEKMNTQQQQQQQQQQTTSDEKSQTATEEDQTSTSTRSKRLRKMSNKYSNYAVEPLTSAGSNKRKSTRSSQQVETAANTPTSSATTTPTSSAKKLRTESSTSKQEEVKTSSISSTRSSATSAHITDSDTNNTETELLPTAKSQNDDDCESTVSSSYSSDLDKRVKRQEKRTRHELDEHSESNVSATATASSIVVKLPRYNLGEDNSSLLVSSSASNSNVSAAVSPIKIKISRNQDDKFKLTTSSYSIDSASSSQSENKPTTSNANKPNIKLNLGELFRSKKNSSSVTLNEMACSPGQAQVSPVSIEETNNSETKNEPKQDETTKSISEDVEMAAEAEEIKQDDTNQEKPNEQILKEDEIKNNESEPKINDDQTVTEETSSNKKVETEQTVELVPPQIETNQQKEVEKEEEKQQKTNITSENNELEPGEVVRAPIPTIILNGTQNHSEHTAILPRKTTILSNTLNTSGLQQQQQQQQFSASATAQQATKFKKIAPALPTAHLTNTLSPVALGEPTVPAILLTATTTTTASSFNIVNAPNPGLHSTRSKRELELEKLLEDKTLGLKEMKQFYEKLCREMKQSHEQQQQQLIREIKYNCDLKISEILKEASKKEIKLRADFERRIVETKMKQWCACCGKEAIYYCCWNTSYCDEDCQRRHWGQHLKTCTRILNDQYGQNSEMNDSISTQQYTTTATTTNGTSYTNSTNDNLNNTDLYTQFNPRPKQTHQQQQQQQKPVHIHQQSSQYQQFSNNSMQKKVPISNNNNNHHHSKYNDQSGFTNNNNSNNNTARKVTL